MQTYLKAETLGLKRLHKKATDQGWNDPNNTQQIVLFNITHNGAVIAIDITKSYGRIDLTKLWTQCRRFMTGADAQHRANQNNQMMQMSIGTCSPCVPNKASLNMNQSTLLEASLADY